MGGLFNPHESMELVPGMICLQKELDLERSKVNESTDLWLFTHKFHVKSCKPACAMKCVLMLIHRIHGILSLHESLICIIYDLRSYDSFKARFQPQGWIKTFSDHFWLQFIEKKQEPSHRLHLGCNWMNQWYAVAKWVNWMWKEWKDNGINHWSLIKTCSWLW